MGRAPWFRRHHYDVSALRCEDAELLYRSYKTSRFANLPDLLYAYRETRGGFRKRLETRIGRIRYLHRVHNTAERGTLYRAALAESIKIVADAALVVFSARYAMLTLREERLSDSEPADWREICGADPERLMVLTTTHETMGSFFTRQIGLLAEEGFHVHAVCSPGAGLDKLKHLPGVTTHGVPMARRPDPLRDFVSFIRLFRLMRRIRPDIVHAHTPKAGLLGMAAARAAGIPVRLYTIHGLPLLTRTGKWRQVLELAERASCTLATQAYSVSPSLQKVVAELNLCPPGKLSTLGDGSCAGIDLERFNATGDWTGRALAVRRAYGIPAGALLLSFVGRIARDKGIAILATAFSELARQFPDLHLLIAGQADSSDSVPEPILQELRNHERVHFTGSWAADMPAVYAATGIVVLPTFREGLPQVALESGAMGVPIVSTRIPGVVNAVLDGVTGLLVPAGETGPFVEAVRRLVDDPPLRTKLGNAARQHIRTRFSEQRVNRLWMSEYRKLIRQAVSGIVDRGAQIENPR